jgi:hypothetical protein
MAFLRNFTLIAFNHDATFQDVRAVADDVRLRGGAVVLASSQVALGWIDASHDQEIVGRHNVSFIARSVVTETRFDLPASRKDRVDTRRLLAFYNSVVTGRLAAQMDRGVGTPRLPLLNDVVYSSRQPAVERVDQQEARESSALKPDLNAQPPFSQFFSMRGWVFILMFLVDSDGSIDPNVYSWNGNTEQDVLNPLLFGYAWWGQKAAARGVDLHFLAGAVLAYNRSAQVSYEPINRPFTDHWLFINEVMTDLDSNTNPWDDGPKRPGGFGATPHFYPWLVHDDVEIAVEDFNRHVAQDRQTGLLAIVGG